MSKERIMREQIESLARDFRLGAQQLNVELAALQMKNDYLRKALVVVLKTFGAANEEHKSEKTLVISRREVEAVEPDEGFQTYSKDSDDFFLIYRRQDAKITFAPKCDCYEGEENCGKVTPKTIEDSNDPDHVKHHEACIFWKSFVTKPQQGPVPEGESELVVCKVHSTAHTKVYGPRGAKCPMCEEERVERIECASKLPTKCSLCGVEGEQVYRWPKKRESARPIEGDFCEKCGKERGWETGFIPVPLYCAHTKKNHLRGVGQCKIGGCACESWTCSHSEKVADNEKRVIRCADPDCSWEQEFDAMMVKKGVVNEDGQVVEVQDGREGAEALPTGRDVAEVGDGVQEHAPERESVPSEPGLET